MANKIIQLKDSQGNNLYPVMTCNIDELASGTGIEKRKLLWTNASPTSDFASQTVGPSQGVVLSGYDAVEIVFKASASNSQQVIEKCEIGAGLRIERLYNPTSASNTLSNMYRGLYAKSESGVEFGAGYKKVATSTSSSIENSYLIPYKIYGVKVV